MTDEEKYGKPFNPFEGNVVEAEEPAAEPTAENTEPVVESAEPVDNTTEQNTGTEGVVEDTAATEPEKEFDTAFFNKSFGTEFKTVDEIKALLEAPTKLNDLEGKVKEYEELQSKYQELSEKYEPLKKYEEEFDPLSLFPSKEDYAWMQYKKDNPDKDASVAHKIFTSDFTKDSDLNVLISYEKLNDPGLEGGEEGIKEMIADKYGIDLDAIDSPSEWTTVVKNKVRRDANLARKEFEEIKSSVKYPDKVNVQALEAERKAAVEAKQAQLTKDWSEITDLMLKEMDKVTIFDDPSKEGKADPLVDFVLDDKMKKELRDGMLSYLTEQGLEPSEENIREAGNTAQARVVLQNLPKIIKGAVNDALSKQEKAHNDEIHNPKKVEAAVNPNVDDEKARIRENALKSPYPSVRKPMF